MSDHSACIRVKNSSINDVREILSKEFGSIFFKDDEDKPFNLFIEVVDNSDAYDYEIRFNKENGLEPEDEVLAQLDLEGFGIEVEVYCEQGDLAYQFINPLIEATARLLSKKLGTQTLVTLWNQETPFALYTSGSKEKDFSQYSARYLETLEWSKTNKT